MKQEYRLINHKVIKALATDILSLEPNEDNPIIATLQEFKNGRSVGQNALLFGVIYTQYMKHSGYTIEQIHKRYKRKFAVPIFVRDDPGYASMFMAVKSLEGENKVILSREIIRLTSTRNFKVKQMSEYIDNVVKDLAENGFAVVLTSDEQSLFMGRI